MNIDTKDRKLEWVGFSIQKTTEFDESLYFCRED